VLSNPVGAPRLHRLPRADGRRREQDQQQGDHHGRALPRAPGGREPPAQVVQVRAQVTSRRVPIDRVLRERAIDDALQRARRIRAGRPQRRGTIAQDRRDQGEAGCSRERPAPGEHLVDHAPEREDVGASVHRPSLRLLGRHVRRRANHGRGARRERRHRVRGRRLLEQLRHAEVEELDQPGTRDDHVCGLEIAMHDPARVRRFERGGDLQAIVQHARNRHRPASDNSVERLPVDELHHDARVAVTLLDVVRW
jgi:hypothetical protein